MVATEERKIAARQNAAKEDAEKHHVSTKQAKGKEA